MTMLMPETAPPAADGAAPTPRLRDQFCFALYATSHAVARRYKPLLAPLGVTYPQYICLMSLWERDDVTVSTLGTAMLLDSGTLTPLLKRLERAGLLLRARDPEDERQVRIRLTDAGRELQRSAAAVMDRIVCATGRPMAEIADLRDDLVAIRQSLDEDTVAAEASLARGPRRPLALGCRDTGRAVHFGSQPLYNLVLVTVLMGPLSHAFTGEAPARPPLSVTSTILGTFQTLADCKSHIGAPATDANAFDSTNRRRCSR